MDPEVEDLVVVDSEEEAAVISAVEVQEGNGNRAAGVQGYRVIPIHRDRAARLQGCRAAGEQGCQVIKGNSTGGKK